MSRSGAEGFTIPELLVASSIFSVVLLATTAVFFTIGHIFFKGITITQTQQSAKKIVDSITADINAASLGFDYNSHSSAKFSGLKYMCLGNTRYSFFFQKETDLSQENISTGKFGLIRDVIPTGCGNPATVPFNNPEELLGDKSRLMKFKLDPAQSDMLSSNIFNITLKIVYGDDGVLSNKTNADTVACIPGLSTSQFCSVTSLFTTVSQGFSQ